MGERKHGFICRIPECPGRVAGCSGDDGRLISLENYVGLAPGREIPMEGIVVSCPLCGRSGVATRTGGRPWVVHVQTIEVMADGLIAEPQDLCCVSAA
jgi:hypothetical protein